MSGRIGTRVRVREPTENISMTTSRILAGMLLCIWSSSRVRARGSLGVNLSE